MNPDEWRRMRRGLAFALPVGAALWLLAGLLVVWLLWWPSGRPGGSQGAWEASQGRCAGVMSDCGQR